VRNFFVCILSVFGVRRGVATVSGPLALPNRDALMRVARKAARKQGKKVKVIRTEVDAHNLLSFIP